MRKDCYYFYTHFLLALNFNPLFTFITLIFVIAIYITIIYIIIFIIVITIIIMLNEEEPMLKEVFQENFVMEKEGRKESGRRTKKRNETNWKEKNLHGKFPKSVVDFADSVLWQWLRSGYVKKNTEAIIIAVAQDQASRTNWIKANIDGVDCSPYVEFSILWMSQPCTLVVDANS